ncbi:MAG: peroxide stress protein YaaA [Agromyces sp.]|nr:peroxide stress protein YaaA [Agromyces sp.]
MLLLLPPSETKRDGGDGVLDLSALSFGEVTAARAELLERVVELAADHEAAMRALKLGPRQAAEVDRNRALREAPTMSAIDRYTGVLYDALDAPTLDADARAFAHRTVVVHSALFGLVRALDPIPAYRLSHDSRVPEVRLRRFWREPLSALLAATPGVILDLRSEGYADLGPAPAREGSVFVRVVSVEADGRRRALNHFNKHAKGRFTRAFVESRPDVASLEELVEWARAEGFRLDLREADRPDAVRELELVA